MVNSFTAGPGPSPDPDLLLRETDHRSANDLQLVVGLLKLQSRRVVSVEAREALDDATARVAVLARARAGQRERQSGLEGALRQVCEALQSQAEPLSIRFTLHAEHPLPGLSPTQVRVLALVVNELATNAIKHAFSEGTSGTITIAAARNDGGDVVVVVDDDGLPFPEVRGSGAGLGLGLAKRLVASIGGIVIMPADGSKRFEIRVPVTVQ